MSSSRFALAVSAAMLALSASAFSAHAQTPSQVSPYGDRPATIDLDNAYQPPAVYVQSVTANSNQKTLSGSFVLLNMADDAVADLQYRVEIYGNAMGAAPTSDPQLLFSETSVRNLSGLLSGEQEQVPFSVDLPSLPAGSYVAQIQLLQTGGRKLGWNRVPFTVKNGTSSFAYLYEQDIVLPEFSGSALDPLSGPNVDPGSSFRITVQVQHAAASPKTFTPVLKIHNFDESRPVLAEIRFNQVTIPAATLSTVVLPVTAPTTPGVYLADLTLQDGTKTVSTIGQYRIVVRGMSADLVSARLVSVAAKAGDTAFAKIEFVGPADAETRGTGTLKVELMDAKGVAGSVFVPAITLSDGVGQGTARIQLTRDLGEDATLHIVIADGNGKTLRDARVPVGLSTQQIQTARSQPTWKLWLAWYARWYYTLPVLAVLVLGFGGLWLARRTPGLRLTLPRRLSLHAVHAVMLLALFLPAVSTLAFGGSNGIEVAAPITLQGNEAFQSGDVNAYRAYWAPVYSQPIVALFVNQPIHNGTYQCNLPIPFSYRVDYAACNNMPAGGRVIARFDLNQGLQTTLVGTSANWVKVYDNIYTQSPDCPASSSCIHSLTVNTTVTLSGLPANATQTTLQVAVKHNAYMDAGHNTLPDDTIDPNDIYFVRHFAQAFNLWLHCLPQPADVQVVKSAITPSVAQGSPISFSLLVTNNGPGVANSVVVTDVIPAGLTYIPGGSDARCAQSGGNIVCTIGTMQSGTNTFAILQFGTSANTACGIVSNTASVSTTSTETTTANNQSTASATVTCTVPTADVQVIKTANTPTVTQGSQASFTITTSNNGPASAQNVVVTDTIPAGLTFVSSSDNRCSSNGATITCSFGTMTAGQQIPVVVLFQTSNQTACSVIPNVATVSTTTSETNTNNNQSQAAVSVTCPTPTADVQIVKTVNTPTVQQGNQGSFTLVTTNNGPSSAQNVTVSDTVPAGLTFVSSSDNRCALFANIVTCNFGTMTSGQQISTVFTYQTSVATACTVIPNVATVSTTTTETNTGNNQSQASMTVVCPNPTADVQIVKTTSTPSISQGGQASFTLVTTNNGPASAQNVTVSDPIPAGLTFVSSTDNRCTANAATVSCNFGTMTNGQQISVTFVFQTSNQTVCSIIPNIATVSTTTPESNTNNNQSQASVSVQCPQLGCIDITKEAFNPAGTAITPPSFTFQLDNGQTTQNDSAGHAHFGNVSVGTHTVTESVPTGWNQLLVTPANGTVTVTAGNQCASVVFKNQQTVPTPPHADIQVTKTANAPTVAQGGQASFTIAVRNNGPDAAQNVTLTDPVPAGLTFVNSSDNRCTLSNSTVTCSFGTVTSGQQITATFVFQTGVQTSCSLLQNVATVTSSTQDDNTTNNQSSASVTVQCVQQTGCIDITKTTLGSNGAAVTPVIPFTFQLDNGQTVQNDSSGHARFSNVSAGTHTVTETVPSGWTQTSVTPQSGSVTVTGGGTCAQITVVNTQAPAPTADVSIQKTGPSTLQLGNTISYQLTVLNAGPASASSVQVFDTFPSMFTYLPGSSDSRCSASNGIVTCQLGTLSAGQQILLQLGFSTPSASSGFCNQTAQNVARVTTSSPESNVANNISQVVSTSLSCPIAVNSCPDVSIDVSDNEDPVRAGDQLDYEIRLDNNSNSSQRVNLRALLDGSTTFNDASDGGDEHGGDEVHWDNLQIDANDSRTIDLSVDVDRSARDGDRLKLQVETDCQQEEETTRVIAQTPPPQSAQLVIRKTADHTEAQPGDVVGYTVSLQNTGTVPITNISVDDVYGTGQLSVLDAGGGSVNGNSIHWTLDRIDPNTTRTLRYTTRMSTAMHNGDIVQNTATFTAAGLTGSASAIVRIIQSLPQTGVGLAATLSGDTSHVSGLGGGSSPSRGGMSAVFWLLTVLAGLGSGTFAARRMLLI